MIIKILRLHWLLTLTLLAVSLGLIYPDTALGDKEILPPASTGVEPVSPGGQELVPSFVLLKAESEAQLALLQTEINAGKGQVLHTFPSRAVIARIPVETVRQLAALPGVAAVWTRPVELAEVEPYGPEAARLAGVWNSLTAGQARSLTLQENAVEPGDAFLPPDSPVDGVSRAESSIEPGFYQTSEYMAGSVAVGVIFLESNGSVDPSTENWTPGEMQGVFNKIVAGLDWWARLDPRAHLSFVYDTRWTQPLPTGVEPIIHSMSSQGTWINEAMDQLGYPSDSYFNRVRRHNNTLRDTYQADWAFTIFVVDSSADVDNRFSDSFFAYAYLGGPFIVLASESDGYGTTYLDAVAAHETGHIFYALDQYREANQPCTYRSGYLGIENQNSQVEGCGSNLTSIMRGQVSPFLARAIDPYAAGQVGWRDSDGDGILDPLDTPVQVGLKTLVQKETGLRVAGTAVIIPYPSPSRTSVTINTLAAVRYRLDAGGWQTATADDGQFNGVVENYSFTVASLPFGPHTLEVAAIDSAGNISTVYAASSLEGWSIIDNIPFTLLLPHIVH